MDQGRGPRHEGGEGVDVDAEGGPPLLRRSDHDRSRPAERVEDAPPEIEGADERRGEPFPVPEPPVDRLVARPGPWKAGPALLLVQLTPPLVERYITFWRVVRPPAPSFIAAT